MGLVAKGPGDTKEVDLSWLDWSLLSDVSPDGRFVVFTETGEGGGRGYSVYLRGTRRLARRSARRRKRAGDLPGREVRPGVRGAPGGAGIRDLSDRSGRAPETGQRRSRCPGRPMASRRPTVPGGRKRDGETAPDVCVRPGGRRSEASRRGGRLSRIDDLAGREARGLAGTQRPGLPLSARRGRADAHSRQRGRRHHHLRGLGFGPGTAAAQGVVDRPSGAALHATTSRPGARNRGEKSCRPTRPG